MNFQLDTNALLRRMIAPRKLSREQNRVLDELELRGQPFAISAITLVELSLLGAEDSRIRQGASRTLELIEESPGCEVLPITVDIAQEMSYVAGALRDPWDSAIVATARVHHLRLLTSDRRIAESGLVSVVE
ncbi:MAG: PIN domain-containing protein [Acidobacteriota bacterium]|nr:PIN domain-containing protein [Acidobacteriota bacterium]